MFAPSNIIPIATTRTGIFNNIVSFNKIAIISTDSTGTTEQLVLATNNGLYRSARVGGVQDALNQVDSAWQLIPNTQFFYNDIGTVDNASIPVAPPTVVWPTYIADSDGQGTFDATVWQQLIGDSDTGPFVFIPPFFNAMANIDMNFDTLPQNLQFWSDGARRLAIVTNIQSSCLPFDIISLPFSNQQWNIQTPSDAFLADPLLMPIESFYWIKLIGSSGLLMVGTNQGIVALG